MNKELLHSLSHELKSPLNSIINLARVMLIQSVDKLDDEEIQYLEIIEKNGNRLLSLIKDLIEYIELEENVVEINIEYINIKTVIEEIIENIMISYKGLSVQIEKQLNDIFIECDKKLIYKIVYNLLKGIVKYNDKGLLSIKLFSFNENCVFEIDSKGNNVDRKVIDRLFLGLIKSEDSFNRFSKIDLGIVIAKRYLDYIGGSVTVDKTGDNGLNFKIYFPVKYKNKTNEKKKILVIDDDTDSVVILKAVLGEKYRLYEAYNGFDGIELVKSTEFDCILLDIALPDINGFEVLKKIRDIDKCKNIPIIIVSASTIKSNNEILQRNCSDLLLKPFSIDDLIQKVDYWINYE